MSALIVCLPAVAAGPATEYRYVVTRDEQSAAQSGTAQPAVLPTSAGREVVAVVPARQLSWIQASLPKGAAGSGQARLRAVLEGLLEDRLLDDPAQMHFALGPQVSDAGGDDLVWIAACNKAWLESVTAPLEQAARPVVRLVPELWPGGAHAMGDVAYLVGEPDDAWLVQPDARGVVCLPASPASLQGWLRVNEVPGDGEPAVARRLWVEPALVSMVHADDAWGRDQVVMQTPQERWIRALQSPWNLAQFEFAGVGAQRTLKQARALAHGLVSGPRWRWARRGVVVALIVNLVGLNAWAWREKQRLADKRQAVQQVLTQTFPHVRVVVDAPAQMAREVEALRQSTGTQGAQDLEPMLVAAAQVVPAEVLAGVQRLDYSPGELRLAGSGMNEAALRPAMGLFGARGLSARVEGDALVLSAAAGSSAGTPTAPSGARATP